MVNSFLASKQTSFRSVTASNTLLQIKNILIGKKVQQRASSLEKKDQGKTLQFLISKHAVGYIFYLNMTSQFK